MSREIHATIASWQSICCVSLSLAYRFLTISLQIRQISSVINTLNSQLLIEIVHGLSPHHLIGCSGHHGDITSTNRIFSDHAGINGFPSNWCRCNLPAALWQLIIVAATFWPESLQSYCSHSLGKWLINLLITHDFLPVFWDEVSVLFITAAVSVLWNKWYTYFPYRDQINIRFLVVDNTSEYGTEYDYEYDSVLFRWSWRSTLHTTHIKHS